MGKNLVIVESPTKAKKIQGYLGNDYKVMASTGHVRDLDEKKLSIDIANGFTPEYVIPANKKKIVSELKSAVKNADTVWLASDEDREGEAISWHLAATLNLDPQKTHRITFNEITETAIKNAVANPRDIDINLVNAQQARRVLDRLVGFELSPVLWRKIQRGLSAGRVQSVALRLVVDREREIEAFKTEARYRVEAVFNIAGNKVKGVLDKTFGSMQDAEKFLNDSIGATFTVKDIEKKEGTRSPAAPFTTSTLQQEASRKLHFPVSLTMRIAQGLYEKGFITYMRTDSTNLSSLALSTAKKFICENFGDEYSKTRQYKTKTRGAQEAHEAIRPTHIDHEQIAGTPQEQKLYQLIWKRTVASQMADASLMKTIIKVASDKRSELFLIDATNILFDGFLKLYIEGKDDVDEEDDNTFLPEMRIGQILVDEKIEALCKYSQPPFRYTDSSLIKTLEKLEIGRPSTYAPTITTLTTGRGYLIKGDKEGTSYKVTNLCLQNGVISSSVKTETVGAEKGKLLPQNIGIAVTDYLVESFNDIVDYDFTAKVEERFDKISNGEEPWNACISEFYAPFHQKVDTYLHDKQFLKLEREVGKDPQDGSPVIAKLGQYGPFIQKGEGDKKQYAPLGNGQLIENITLEEALALFQLPRTVGQIDGVDVVVTKGRFGPYIKFGDKNISLPRGTDPLSVSLEECSKAISSASEAPKVETLLKFESSDIEVIQGRYGPYIKHAGSNYKIPAGTDASTLTEEACKQIIADGAPTQRKKRFFKKK